MKVESLSDRVNRAKARWLKRVMQDPSATSTQKCLAYAIADYLNCVTLDCWPAQPTLARILGHKSVKTVQRAARGLATLRLITLKHDASGKAGCRYAPVLWPEDMDKPVPKNGHRSPEIVDTNDRESFLRGPRIIAVAGNRGHLWGEQYRIETRTKRNHSWVNSGRLTIGGNYSRSPYAHQYLCAVRAGPGIRQQPIRRCPG